MKPVRNIFNGLFVLGGVVALISLLHAQETATLTPSGAVSVTATTDVSAMSDLEVEVKAIEMTTPLPASAAPVAGNFYSTQHLPGTANEWPPLPENIKGTPIWPLGDDFYLLDDATVSYNPPTAKKLTVTGGMQTMAMNSLSPVSGEAMSSYTPLNLVASTNLWLAITNLANGTAGLLLSNTIADVQYEILAAPTLTGLMQTGWVSLGSVYGSELTNWTPASVVATNQPTLFLRARSDIDSDNIGIPDWWQLLYFGYVGINPYAASPSGDGFTIWHKYQNGLNPNSFETPPAPNNFVAVVSTNGTDILLSWNTAQGTVANYSVVRGVYNPDTGDYSYSTIATPNSGTTSFLDAGAVQSDNDLNDYYELAAVYSGGKSSQTTFSYVYTSAPPPPTPPTPIYNVSVNATLVRNATGRWQLVFSAIPAGVQTVRLDWDGFDYYYDYGTYASEDISTNSITNNCYVLTDAEATNNLGALLLVQGVGANNEAGNASQAGFLYSDAPCFVDAREHLKQNLIFQLRGATLSQPVGVSGNLYPYPFISPADTNYVESSIFHPAYDYDETLGAVSYVQMNNLWPFDLNYQFHQFLYDTNYTGPSGFLWQTNFATVPAPAVLGLADPYWIRQDPENMADLGLYLSSGGTVVTLNSSAHNLFGLNIETDLNIGPSWGIPIDPATGLPIYIPTFDLAPGASANILAGQILATYYSQFQAPSLSTVGYYFAPVQNTGPNLIINGSEPSFQSIPIPALNGFAATNQTPLLIAAVGSTTVIGGWAKQAILNGANNKYAYLGQYFVTNAFLLNTNGAVTTNSAGIVSPYGEFFPTQAGQAQLITMPDIDTGRQGTCTVSVVSLNVDANHDGTMDLSYFGQDQTSPGKPCVFWCNNNFDRWDNDFPFFTAEQDDQQSAAQPDCNFSDGYGDRMIPCTRDLEDFTRLWISGVTSNLLAALPIGGSVTLSWGDVGNPNPNNPMIDLFTAADADGGIGYLTNETTAAAQTNILTSPYVQRLGPGGSIQLNTLMNQLPTTHFIWCGVANGSGKLTLSFKDGNGNVLGQASVWIQIQDIKQMYERWTVGDDSAQPPATTAYLSQNGLVSGEAPFLYGPATTNTPYILLVHGYNMAIWEKDTYAQTAFKRLYWQGYQGRFGAFNWPTAANPAYFGTSELQAWNSAQGLLNKLEDLNAIYPGKVYLAAHSLGNVVAGEALRLTGNSQVVNTYIAMQGAVAAHAYDPSTAAYNLGSYYDGAPDCYAHYWTNGAPCLFNASVGAGAYVNFFNLNDWALTNAWLLYQIQKHNLNPGYSYNAGTGAYSKNFGITPLSFPANTYELFGNFIQAPCFALGMQPNVGGVFKNGAVYNQVELDISPYNFDREHIYHSGEFRSDNAQRWQFWNQVLVKAKLK